MRWYTLMFLFKREHASIFCLLLASAKLTILFHPVKLSKSMLLSVITPCPRANVRSEHVNWHPISLAKLEKVCLPYSVAGQASQQLGRTR